MRGDRWEAHRGAEDLAPAGELSDGELEAVSRGTFLPPTMSVLCGTNGSFCTFNPCTCQ